MVERNENSQETNFNELAQAVQLGFDEVYNKLSQMEEKFDARLTNVEWEMTQVKSRIAGVEKRLAAIEEGTLTQNEKNELFAMLRHYDDQLVAEWHGHRITLTRLEYDCLMEQIELPNRYRDYEQGLGD